jgi:hypothetical protein
VRARFAGKEEGRGCGRRGEGPAVLRGVGRGLRDWKVGAPPVG